MNKIPLTEISKVPHYGQHFPFIPWTLGSKIKVSFVFAKHLYHKIGLLNYLQFWLLLPFRLPNVLQSHKEGLRLMQNTFGWMAKVQWILLIIIYEVLEKKVGKEEAYQYAKDAIQDGATFMMNEFYQAEELAKFEDPYLAFWEYHKAMFKDDPNFENEVIEGEDCHKMIVHNCRNCAIANLTIPALASLGCDHDIAGFQAIADKIQMDFRRPVTLAKDGKPCQFMFFRKGMAPEGIETK